MVFRRHEGGAPEGEEQKVFGREGWGNFAAMTIQEKSVWKKEGRVRGGTRSKAVRGLAKRRGEWRGGDRCVIGDLRYILASVPTKT